MTTESSYEKLYRKQCEEHEATWRELQSQKVIIKNLRTELLEAQNVYKQLLDRTRKFLKELEA